MLLMRAMTLAMLKKGRQRDEDKSHVGETALHIVVSAECEIPGIFPGEFEVVVTDAVDCLRIDRVLNPCLQHAYEGHRAQEDERRKDHEREEAEIGHRAASL